MSKSFAQDLALGVAEVRPDWDITRPDEGRWERGEERSLLSLRSRATPKFAEQE